MLSLGHNELNIQTMIKKDILKKLKYFLNFMDFQSHTGPELLFWAAIFPMWTVPHLQLPPVSGTWYLMTQT